MPVGKPGLDGHSNGAEQIALRARDCGMEAVYEGIRLTPARIANAALEDGVHVVGRQLTNAAIESYRYVQLCSTRWDTA